MQTVGIGRFVEANTPPMGQDAGGQYLAHIALVGLLHDSKYCLAVSCHVFSYLLLPCLALPCFALLRFASLCLAVPCRVLSYIASPCIVAYVWSCLVLSPSMSASVTDGCRGGPRGPPLLLRLN